MPTEKNVAATIKRAGELRAAHLPLRKIAELLEKEGYPPAGNRSKWHHAGVRWCLDRLPDQQPPPPATPPPPPEEAGKPSLKIEVHGPYTRTDRLLWAFLLESAEPELGQQDIHTLPLPVVLAALKTANASPTRRHLWEALQRLTASRISWDGKVAPRHSSVSTPLLSAHLNREDDVLLFHFCPFLLQLLRNNKENARLQLLLDSKKH